MARRTTPKTTLTGVVTAVGGGPLAGVVVGARKHDAKDPEFKDTTDDQGRYRLEGLRRRITYVISVEVQDGRQDVARVRMTKQEQTEDVSLPAGGPAMSDTTTTTSVTDTDTTTTASDSTTATGSTTATESTTATDSTTTVTAAPGNGGNGAGGADAFDRLVTLMDDPKLAPEPPVNIGEAKELARLFVVSMHLLAGVPTAIARLQERKEANFTAGDLTFQGMDDPALRGRIVALLDKRPAPTSSNNEDELRGEVRAGLNLGTATVPSVNTEFAELYRRAVSLAADDSNAVDPDQVVAHDVREAAVIRNFMRDFRRALLRLTQNMSVYGTRGTKLVVDLWSEILAEAIGILRDIGENNVVSADIDDKAPWSVLAALTDTPRGTVKSYIVNARDGGWFLRLTIGIYEALQAQTKLDEEDDPSIHGLFFGKVTAVVPSAPAEKYGEKTVGEALKQHGSLLRDYVAPLWP